MTEEIQKRIDGIIAKRKKYIDEYLGFLCKYNDWYFGWSYDNEIIINYKFKKHFLKQFPKGYHKEIKKITVLKGFWYYNGKLIQKLPAEKWNAIKKLLTYLKAYILEYKESLKKKELHRLTNCLRTLEGNPCEITCEKCGYENQIGAKYCSKCGELI